MTITAVLTVTDPADDTFDYQARLQPNGDWHVFHGLQPAGVIKFADTGYQAKVGARFGGPFDRCGRRVGHVWRDPIAAIKALHEHWDYLAKLDEAEAAS